MKFLFFANTDWYQYNYRLGMARAIQSRGDQVVLVCPPGPYVAKLRDLGFRVVEIPMDRKSLSLRKELGVLYRVYRLLRRESPDLIHNYTLKPVVYGSLAARLAGVESRVNSVTGLGYVFTSEDLRARLLRPIVTLLLRMALSGSKSRLIVQNDSDFRQFVDRRIIDSNAVVTIRGSGVDTDRFRPGEARLEKEETVVCMATRLLRQKGIEEYIDAARMLHARNLPLRFVLAGAPDPGNPGAVTRAELEEWRREGVVELVGHVDDMAALLKACDMVVLPSSYGEGVPRVLLEAAATGLPVVATDIPGCRDVVRHGVNGLLVPPREPRKLADAIASLHADPTLRSAMGVAGREQALEQFDERVIIGKTFEVYTGWSASPVP